jgi:iron complex outermembrane recepter protein
VGRPPQRLFGCWGVRVVTIHRKRGVDLLQALICEKTRPLSHLGACILAYSASGVAGAQSVDSEELQKQQVQITGTRLKTGKEEAVQEVKIYTREQIDQSGQTTLADFLNTLPVVSVSITENSFQTIGGTPTIQLRGLPIGTTLILINGRRVSTSGAPQFTGLTYFDLNTIPLATVDRIEVVSEGSSAIYGSDAIAGVVNVILKENFSGVQVNNKTGFAPGINEDNADLTWGHRWDTTSLTLSGTYQTRTELPGFDRPLTNNQDYRRYGGRNANLFTCPNLGDIYSLNGGNLPGVGAPYAAVPSNYTGAPTQQEFRSTAGSLNQCSVFRYVSDIAGTERGGALLRGVTPLTPSAEVYTDVLFSSVHQSQYGPPPILFGQPGFQSYTVSSANPFNPFGQTIGVSEMASSLGRSPQDLTTRYINAVLGVRGSLSDTWKWDVAVWDSQDRTHLTFQDLNPAAVQADLNSPNSATALNPFVAGPLGSSQVLQSITTQDRWDFLGRAVIANGIARGRVFDLPAGPFELALGGEYERDTLFEHQFPSPGPAKSTDFHRHSYAFFAEGRLPLLGGGLDPGFGDLALTPAGRFDHYNDFGDKSTPQIGVEWRPYAPLLLRAVYSRSFRAPDLIDLYATTFTTNHLAVTDPLRGNTAEVVTATSGGNPRLKPETGSSRTIGLIYSPETARNLRLAITHWAIDESNWIQQLPAQVIVDNAALFPGAVTRAGNCSGGPPCPITSVTATYLNFGHLYVAGLDYQLTLKDRTSVGTFSPSITATQTYRYTTTLVPGSPAVNAVSAAQDSGNWAPRWKGVAALEWQYDAWSTNLAGRYVGSYQDYDSKSRIGDFWLFDFSARCALGDVLAPETNYWRNAYLRAGAVNLLNRQPQFSNFESDLVGYDPAQADIRGRFLYVQVGTKW